MKKIATGLIALFAMSAWAQSYVRPHVNKDGTYVEGHMRSAPNNTNTDNYGTKGNTNPFTGQAGTIQPNYYPQQQQQPRQQLPSYGQQQCGYTQAGNYVCR